MASKLKDIAKVASIATAGLCGIGFFTQNCDKYSDIIESKSKHLAIQNLSNSLSREKDMIINPDYLPRHVHHVNNNNNHEKIYEHAIRNVNESGARPNEQGRQQQASEKLKAAVEKSKHLVWAKLYEAGIPGLAIAVSVDGKMSWKHGFGYADVENRVLANSATVMRIASISKSITAAAVAKLHEEGLLDLDKPVTEYVESWPKHHPTITTRQLLSHMSGIRHYERGSSEPTNDKSVKEKLNSKSVKESLHSNSGV